jgi:branched-subunit amino acid aminotransferase/4-amino-4-deoxychorismate lyase
VDLSLPPGVLTLLPEWLALAMARERSPIPIEPTLRISREHVARARELIALNAVRGARAITQLEGQAIGSGEPGPVCRELERLLLSD